MREGCRGRPPFHTEAALVHRKPGVAQHVRRLPWSRDEHPALKRAVRAVCRDRAAGGQAGGCRRHVGWLSSRLFTTLFSPSWLFSSVVLSGVWKNRRRADLKVCTTSDGF